MKPSGGEQDDFGNGEDDADGADDDHDDDIRAGWRLVERRLE